MKRRGRRKYMAEYYLNVLKAKRKIERRKNKLIIEYAKQHIPSNILDNLR
jgi:hypothetical protein